MGWFGNLLGAAAGPVIGGLMANSAQRSANRTNVRLQREQRQWEENMSNTAWQRGTKDMLAAGINPMLAISQGPASTPNVSAATVEPAKDLGRAIASIPNPVVTAQQVRGQQLANETAEENLDITKFRNDIEKGYRNPLDPQSKDQLERETAIANRDRSKFLAALEKENVTARDLENQIVRQTMGATVASAKTRAQILEQEVGLNDIRSILMSLDIPEKEALAEWFDTVGAASPAIKAFMAISKWIAFIVSRGRL